MPRLPSPHKENLFSSIIPTASYEPYLIIPRLKIDPPRLMFAIWSTAPELKGGNKKSLKNLKVKFPAASRGDSAKYLLKFAYLKYISN